MYRIFTYKENRIVFNQLIKRTHYKCYENTFQVFRLTIYFLDIIKTRFPPSFQLQQTHT